MTERAGPGYLPVVLAAGAVFALSLGLRQAHPLFISALNSHTAAGYATISLAFGIAQLMWGVAQPIAGGVADRWGLRPVMVAGALLLAAASAALPLATNAAALILLIGICGAMGLCVAVGPHVAEGRDVFLARVRETARLISSTRPTAVNLSWALDRVVDRAKRSAGDNTTIVAAMREEATAILEEDRAIAPGTELGPYTVVGEIGRGGMGRVYLASDGRLGRTVALKSLPPELTRDAAHRDRLRREARAAALLTHPGICTVFALEELEGELYIATEFVEGHTLREEIGTSNGTFLNEARLQTGVPVELLDGDEVRFGLVKLVFRAGA